MMRRFLNIVLGTLIAIAAVAPAHAGITISGQVPNSKLTDIAALAVTDSNVIVGNGTTWVAESGATARTSLGVAIGTDVQAYNATLAAVAGGTYTGDDSIATVGTITAGIWNAGAVTSSGGLSGTTGAFTDDVTISENTNTSLTISATDGVNGRTATLALKASGNGGDGDAVIDYTDTDTTPGTPGDLLFNKNGATQASLSPLGAFLASSSIRAGSLTAPSNVTATGAGVFAGGIAFTDVLNAWIDDAATGSGTVTHYIGNQSITTSSDRRVKTDIKPTSLDALRVIRSLKVMDFNWSKDSTQAKSYNGGQRIPGLIAQDAVKVLPMFVNTNTVPADGPLPPGQEWKIDYQAMVPVLIKALQEESAKRESLEVRLAALEGLAPATGSGVPVSILRAPAPAAKPTATPKPAAPKKKLAPKKKAS